jgi:hypothetical protein
MKSTVEIRELAAMNWCARIVQRPIGSIGPSSSGGLAHLYAVHFKQVHQTARLPRAAMVSQSTTRKD